MAMLSKREVVKRTGLSATTLWRRIKIQDFPRPRQLTPNRVGWTESSIEEWENSRPVGQCELPANFEVAGSRRAKKKEIKSDDNDRTHLDDDVNS